MLKMNFLKFCLILLGILFLPALSYAQFFNLGAFWKNAKVEEAHPGEWSVRMHAPEPTSRASAVWTGTEMIIFGGFIHSTQTTDKGYRYNPTTDTWALLPLENGPSSRGRHTMTWTGTEAIVWGGVQYNGTWWSVLNTGAKYNPATDTWIAMPTTGAPAAVYNHTAVWTDSQVIVWGGNLDGSDTSRSGGVYDPSTNTWIRNTSEGSGVPVAREGHGAVWDGSSMIVWGGSVSSYWVNKYDPTTDSWTYIAAADYPALRKFYQYVWTGTEFVVFGGQAWNSATAQAGGAKFNPTTNTWSPIETAGAPSARYGHSMEWDGTNIIIWGGTPYDLGETYKYNPSTDTWSQSYYLNTPSVRHNAATVWTGTEMIVWGGNGSIGYLKDGGKFNPSTDTWTQITSGRSAPYIPGYATAVWTGSEVLFFGGSNGTASNQGYRYNYATDTWSAMDTTNAYAKIYHTAVWTGTEMIVWGGDNATSVSRAGAAYNPTTDTWTQITTTSAPTARRRHVAVWTGSQMIVWGGWDNTDVLDTGARLTWPAGGTGSWAATSTTNRPGAVNYHEAVWTGTEMYVMGGLHYLCSGTCNQNTRVTVKSYNPSSDTWTTRADMNESRYRQAAVWTGDKILVWGGTVGTGTSLIGYSYSYRDSGEVYNPATDTWTLMPSSGLAARSYVPSVWTGAEMIIWGGNDASYYYRDGARYNPSTNKWTIMETEGRPSPRGYHPAVAIDDSKMLIVGGNESGGNPYWGNIHIYSVLTDCAKKLNSGTCEAVTGCDWSGGSCASNCSEPLTQSACEKIYTCEWSGGSCQSE